MSGEKAENYFESYDNIDVHNLMLRDEPRVRHYRDAILNSKELFKDKIVLDVGSGTGILSLFSAQAGAKHVYAVEASVGIFELSKAIIKANKLENKITVINGEIEKIALPDGVQQVDIIVSEWMGVYLVHESMLGSVLYARDKWLRKDGLGLMYPSFAYLYCCPVQMNDYLEKNLKYWINYNNLDFEPVARVYRQLLLEKPIVEQITQDNLIGDEDLLASFDLSEVAAEELESIQKYNIEFIANKSEYLHGFAFWFDCIFKTDKDIVTLSTAPNKDMTHWKQTIAFLPDALYSYNTDEIKKIEADEKFECYVIMNQSDENKRHYEIQIGVDLKDDKEEELSGEEDEEEDDDTEHPTPCECGKIRCVIIKAALDRYENEKIESTKE